MTELTGVLAQIARPERVQQLTGVLTRKLLRRKAGYENLLRSPVADLTDGATLKDKSVTALSNYFGRIARLFAGDWTNIRQTGGRSAFRRTKMFGGWIRLLRQFVDEGATWDDVQEQLEKIKRNVSRLGNRRNPILVFDESVSSIPNVDNKPTDFLKFLRANRIRKTSIRSI